MLSLPVCGALPRWPSRRTRGALGTGLSRPGELQSVSGSSPRADLEMQAGGWAASAPHLISLSLNLALGSRLPSFGALILWIQCSPTLETARPLQETLPAPQPLLVGVRDTRTHAQTQYMCVQSSRVRTHDPTHAHGYSVTIVAGRGLRGGGSASAPHALPFPTCERL